MKINKEFITSIVAVLVMLGITLGYFRIKKLQNDKEYAYNLVKSLNDTVKTWKDKKGQEHNSISVIEYRDKTDFLALNSKDKEIQALQKEIKNYKGEIKTIKSVTKVSGVTKFDTIYVPKTQYLGANVTDSIKNKFIDTKFGFVDGKVVYNLKVKDSATYIIGETRGGLFKKGTLKIETINHNPYSTNTGLRTVNFEDTRPKVKIKIRPYAGYGLTLGKGRVIYHGAQVGAGFVLDF